MGCSASQAKLSAESPEPSAPSKARQSRISLGAPRASSQDESILPEKYLGDISQYYDLGKILGKGQFGTTRLAISKTDNEKVACKTISKRKLTKKQDRDDVRQEVAIMDHLAGHPNIVSLINAYEDRRSVHIVMELCTGGELFDRIVSRGHYSEKAAAAIIREIVSVVEHCHAMGVVHRDLKPENFLLASTGNASVLKAIDFGLSTFFQPDVQLTDIVGSAYYVAPEVLRKNYSSRCDIWSCGVILYILLCGIPPFYAETETQIFRAIMRGHVDFESHPWPQISDAAKDCVRKMLAKDTNKRATAQQILQGVASDEPLQNEIQKRLQRFQNLNKLKRQALKLIASYMLPEEVAGLRNQFEALDNDKNGTITVEELHAALNRSSSSAKIVAGQLEAALATIDLNNSGAIDYEEFLAATLHASKAAADEHLERAFAEFDKDGSGTITVDELRQALGVLGGSYEAGDVKEILAKVDINKDGHIDYNEFVDMMRPRNEGRVRRRNNMIKV